MRILIEHGSSRMDNLGDIAMLQVTVERLQALWPEAVLSVITRSEASLARQIPSAAPVLIDYPSIWTRLKELGRPGLSHLPQPLRLGLEAGLSRALPAPFKRGLEDAVGDADLVVHAGSGVFADPFLPAAYRRLDLFGQAFRQGKATALFSQGIGPLRNRRLRRVVAETMADADLVTVRDADSAALLAELVGSKQERFPVTGDDALELAHRSRHDVLGPHLGLNLRFAPYSAVAAGRPADFDDLTAAVGRCVEAMGAAIVPLAIHPSDFDAVDTVLDQRQAWPVEPAHSLTLAGLLKALASCQVVITGSYHGAVLALGQGVPAVCLCNSDYYRRKFSGLAGQFPGDCRLLDLSVPAERAGLADVVSELRDQAADRRADLLRSVSRHIDSSRAAYGLLPGLIKPDHDRPRDTSDG